jgi:hypothetical protein
MIGMLRLLRRLQMHQADEIPVDHAVDFLTRGGRQYREAVPCKIGCEQRPGAQVILHDEDPRLHPFRQPHGPQRAAGDRSCFQDVSTA